MGRYRQPWTPNQIKLIQFIGRGKKTKKGEKRTMKQFADAIGVHRDTLYDWMVIPGFQMAIVEYAIAQRSKDIPALVDGQMRVAKGQAEFDAITTNGKKIKLKPNTAAFSAIMKLMGSTDKVEMEADVKAEVNHTFSSMSDEQLKAIVNG